MAALREACAAEPGLAGELRHAHKLDVQYRQRLQGTRLVPLVAEIGGRWHFSVPRLVRQLAKECATRTSGPGRHGAAAAIAARWGARLSALLIRGNAAVQRAAQPTLPFAPRSWCEHAGPLPHVVPEGESLYEIICMPEVDSYTAAAC